MRHLTQPWNDIFRNQFRNQFFHIILRRSTELHPVWFQLQEAGYRFGDLCQSLRFGVSLPMGAAHGGAKRRVAL